MVQPGHDSNCGLRLMRFEGGGMAVDKDKVEASSVWWRAIGVGSEPALRVVPGIGAYS
jgi:hypothetical protein